MTMRVLVTGATTPIGLALVAALLADPTTELVLAVGAERDPMPLGSQAASRYRYRQVDLTRSRGASRPPLRGRAGSRDRRDHSQRAAPTCPRRGRAHSRSECRMHPRAPDFGRAPPRRPAVRVSKRGRCLPSRPATLHATGRRRPARSLTQRAAEGQGPSRGRPHGVHTHGHVAAGGGGAALLGSLGRRRRQPASRLSLVESVLSPPGLRSHAELALTRRRHPRDRARRARKDQRRVQHPRRRRPAALVGDPTLGSARDPRAGAAAFAAVRPARERARHGLSLRSQPSAIPLQRRARRPPRFATNWATSRGIVSRGQPRWRPPETSRRGRARLTLRTSLGPPEARRCS